MCIRDRGKVDVLLAPAASVIYPENVPANAPLLDEDAYLDQLSACLLYTSPSGTRQTDSSALYSPLAGNKKL